MGILEALATLAPSRRRWIMDASESRSSASFLFIAHR